MDEALPKGGSASSPVLDVVIVRGKHKKELQKKGTIGGVRVDEVNVHLNSPSALSWPCLAESFRGGRER